MFGFAVQPRLGSIGSRFAQPTQAAQPPQAPAINFAGMATGNMNDIRSGLSKLGIGSPPAGAAPVAPAAPTMPPMSYDPNAMITGLPSATAAAAPAADTAGAAGAGDAAAAGGFDISQILAFLGL